MSDPKHAKQHVPLPTRRACLVAMLSGSAALLSACGGGQMGDFASQPPAADGQAAPPVPAGPPQGPSALGTGQVKVALLLPMSASGNIASAALSMKNAAEMALAEFQGPNVSILIKDDRGSASGAAQAAQEAMGEGAEIILGPLFAQAVSAVGQVARPRGIPVIAFSTDANAATRGVYLLSLLPESDVDRIVDFQVRQGKRSFAALIPNNAYGSVVEAAFKQTVARRGGRIVALENYDQSTLQNAARTVAQAAGGADAIFIPDDATPAANAVQALNAAGAKRVQLLGTGLWEDARNTEALQGGFYAAPDPAGFRAFAGRYRAKYGQDPIRTATFAYDAVALVAALVKTQGADRFSEQVLTNPSGFAGIDGLFRFRNDGTNQRGLAVLKVAGATPQVVSPPPRSFTSGT